MRVVALSDTHTRPALVRQVMARLAPLLEGAQHVLHAGDVTSPELLSALGAHAPVTAVAGNMDPPELRGALPEETVLTLDGVRFGLVHGWGAPQDLPRRVWERFADTDGVSRVDVLVFGHSHRPHVETRDGVLLVNPGSAVERRGAPHCTLAVFELGAEIDVRIVRV